MTYKPAPIPTDGISLSPEIQELGEQLAESVHDVWAQARLNEGWTYGPQRDDNRKTHPGLVPYAELSESEKDYDRRTAEQTLKAILALGWKISRNP